MKLCIHTQLFRLAGLTLVMLFASKICDGHVIVKELDKMSKGDAAIYYVLLGYKHILPLGFDHILFILSLFLLSPKLKTILVQSTAFTLAHSITLALAMYRIVDPPVRIVEPLIALSILYVALENIVSPRLKPSRVGIVFLFGLIHGLGFAGALHSMGLPKNAYLTSLVMFNAGVELGQVTVILAAYYTLAKWYASKPYYRSRFVVPLSCLIVVVAGYWTVERLLF